MPTGGRKTHLPLVHEISIQLSGADPRIAAKTPIVVGVLPPGALLNGTHALVSQVFNSTTNSATIGTTPGGAELATIADMKTAPVAVNTTVPAVSAGPLSLNTPVYFTANYTGAAPTQGLVTVYVDYLAGPG